MGSFPLGGKEGIGWKRGELTDLDLWFSVQKNPEAQCMLRFVMQRRFPIGGRLSTHTHYWHISQHMLNMPWYSRRFWELLLCLIKSLCAFKYAKCKPAIKSNSKVDKYWQLRSGNGAITEVKVTHALGTNTAPYQHRCWLLKLVTIFGVLFQFRLEDLTSNALWHVDSSDHGTLFHFSWSNLR